MTGRISPTRAVRLRRWLGACALGLVLSSPAAAQVEPDWDPTQTQATRDALQALQVRYERAAASTAYSDSLRAEASEQARLIRERLEQGDFPPGSRVAVWVEEHANMTDTFAVAGDRTITIAGVGPVSLSGVLRSELQGHILGSVSRIIRDPRVRTQSMMTISIDGEVTQPGHYQVVADNPLSEVLMRGGAMRPHARPAGARVERAGVTIVDPDRFQTALRTGTSIDQLGMREGDRIVVPESRGQLFDSLRSWTLAIPALLGLLTFF